MTENTMKYCIPTTKQVTEHPPITSPFLRFVQHHYSLLQLQADITRWNLITYNHHKLLKTTLSEESINFNTKNLEN